MKRAFTLIELMIVVAIVATLAAIAIPGLLAAQRAANERNASASLRTLLTAQADFRSNDRDGNRVQDFWSGDIFAFYGLVPMTGPAFSGDVTDAEGCIKLIEPSLAGADMDSDLDAYDNVTIDASIGSGSPKAGYLFRAFDDAQTAAGPVSLGSDTDGAQYYVDVHDFGRYAYLAAPTSRFVGEHLFIVNEDHTIWKYRLPDTYDLDFTPMSASGDSTNSITGTGQAAFDGASFYPFAPGALGCSKLD
jgi:prepilin-type N-terminal cleavage/methylation domain-containing protein